MMMEALIKRCSLLFAAVAVSFSAVNAQEVDDMYFTKKDRKKLNDQNISINKNMPSAQTEEATEHVYNNENAYSEEHVNPEYLARYGNQTDTPAGQDEYYTDQTTSGNISQPPVVNNYYMSPRPYFAPSFNMGYSPWGWGWGMGMSFGYGSFMPRYGYGGFYDPWYDPWRTWGPRWSVSMSFGFGWGSSMYYDPFYRNTSMWGWGGGAWGYCPPGYGNNIVVINNYESRYNRTFRAGSGPSRSNVDRLTTRGGTPGTNEGDGFSSRTGDFNSKAVTPSRVASSSAVPTRRNISRSATTSGRGTSQSDYYRRSQSSRTVSNDIVSRSTRSRSEFSSPNSNYSTRSRVANSSRTTSLSTPTTTNSRVTSGNRPAATTTYRPRSSSNTGRSYNGYSAPARSSTSRYSTPSRSRSSSPSFNRSSSPSRSSGSYRSSSPSRSSGSFRSSSPSRSSSGSRSSGASRSSSGSRSSSSGVRRSN